MHEFFDLDGKVAFVTGTTSGLGRHFALTLARAGAHVALTGRRGELLEALAAEIAGFDGRAMPVRLDVRDPEDVRRAVDAAETELGPIEILVNNAGIAIQKRAEDYTDEDYAQIVETNMNGSWFCAQAVGQRMIRRGRGGKIINISSLIGLRPINQLALYAMTKAAIGQLTRALALEWARHDIQVNAICPGYIETEMNRDHWQSPPGQAFMKRFPRRRVGTPEDLDGILLLLASARSDFMTGAVMPIDDGQQFM